MDRFSSSEEPFQLHDLEVPQISIGPGIPKEKLDVKHGVALESNWLE
jgi:hypothetical protein